MLISSKQKFYLSLLGELITSPYEYGKNFIKWHFIKSKNKSDKNKKRIPVKTNKLAVCIHEWGGYEGKRLKKIKNIPEFECGLDYQLLRFKDYKGSYDLNLTLTISDFDLLKSEINNVNIKKVSNVGMDFSGYEVFFESIKEEDNQYVILTNTSVSKKQTDFIDDYLDFFKANESIGMMGVSFNTKMYQSLIRNNFNPHLQSFFLITTTEVLKEVVSKNGSFPGSGIDHKLALIKYGEIKLSRTVMDLGYKLGCVLDNGQPLLFDKNNFTDNGRHSWDSFFGDYRLNLLEPNSINTLNSKKIKK
ncbi:hypothetical protein [Flavobacterium frigoris]|uniref:Uncharacterized protein n=1 Tax=Flavobacterium frigoris (strain PS1) TaxID=1086011 RepID=H7FMK0_FLAFP|nr:hypothetical protein [Flavobacterium frigoris]EIA10212.1 hypothetical protein HJ01_00307 [Flavobacterium frigoris PS1]